MPIVKCDVLGYWLEITYRSENGGGDYTIQGAWDSVNEQWEIIDSSCTCKGSGFNGTCSHIAKARERARVLPAPKDAVTPLNTKEAWLRCGVCGSPVFMVLTDNTGLLCDKCGKLYVRKGKEYVVE